VFICLLTSMLLDIVARECLDFMNNKLSDDLMLAL